MRALRRTTSFVRSAALGIVLLLGAWPASAQESGGDSPAPPLPAPEQIAETRELFLAVLEDYALMSQLRGWKELGARSADLHAVVEVMSDQDVAVFVPAADAFRAWSARNAEVIAALSEGGPRKPAKAGSTKTAGLPDPDYSTVCGDTPSNSDAMFAALIAYNTAKIALEVAKDYCNQTVISPLPLAGCAGGNTRIACMAASAAMAVAEYMFGLIEVCDHLIELEEGVAVYERMQHIHDDLQAMAEDLDFIRKMLTCVPVVPLKLRSGCNGTDDDCDTPKVIDECDEDVFGPSVIIHPSVANPWYPSLAAARQAAENAVIAVDDCQSVTVGAVTVVGSCDNVVAQVTAVDACANQTTATLTMKVDGTPPQVIISPDVAGDCFATVAQAEAAVRAQTSIQDDCAPLEQLNVRVDSSLEGCDLRVRIEARNLAGLRTVAATTVRVDPNPPVVTIDRAVSERWYRTMGEASAALLRATSVTDDCHDVTLGTPQFVGTCGTIVGRMFATDACGNAADAQVTLHVDAIAPVVSLPAGLANACYPSAEAAEQAALAQAIIVDDCTPRVDLEVAVRSSLAECGLRVTVSATDLAGLTGSASITLRVDAAPPVIAIDEAELGFKGDPLSYQLARCYASSSEAEAAVLAVARAGDNCTPGASVTRTVSSSGSPCNLTVTARATDACGYSSTDSVTVRVDATAPAVTAAVATNRLTPADKRWVDVGLTYTISDACTAGIVPVITVTSDESAWNGGTSPAPDAEILPPVGAGPFRVRLRAECNSPGDGRVYRIQVRATDACGNSGSAAVLVTVPNTSGQQVDSGQYYNALAIN